MTDAIMINETIRSDIGQTVWTEDSTDRTEVVLCNAMSVLRQSYTGTTKDPNFMTNPN